MRSDEKELRETLHASRNSLFSDVVRRFVRNRAAMLGLVILSVVLFVIIIVGSLVIRYVLSDHDPKPEKIAKKGAIK